MYEKIMIPVDLSHLDALAKALETGADLARHFHAEVCYVGVTTNAPSSMAHNPSEFARKLEAFAAGEAARHDLTRATSRAYASHDPAVDLDATLEKAIAETGADLVVIGSHRPGVAEHLFASHGGHMATHAKVSVLVVR